MPQRGQTLMTRLVRDGSEIGEGALGIIRALLVTAAMAEVV